MNLKQSWGGNHVIQQVSGSDMIRVALSEATDYHAGQIESLNSKLERLSDIVGRMLDEMPVQKALDIVQLCGWEIEK